MLTDRQMLVLRAAVDRVIPPDEWPGGWEAGVGDYLMGQFGRDLADEVEEYRSGLDGLDAEAVAVAGTGFVELDAGAQDAVLAQVEKGTVASVWAVTPEAFFRRLVEHTAEGFYSDPGNGGNRNEAAWKMIGFEVRG